MQEPSERLFFALWPSAEVRAKLVQRVAPLCAVADGRRVPPDNYHLTLVFLDSVPVSAIPDVVAAARTIAFKPVSLTLDCYGVFERPKVLWYGSAVVPEPLQHLVRDLRASLENRVTLRPERIFCPHVSVVRKSAMLPELASPAKLVWQATDFALVRSEYGPGHAIYTVLERFYAGSS